MAPFVQTDGIGGSIRQFAPDLPAKAHQAAIRFVGCAWLDIDRATHRKLFWAMLALGLANLLAGMAFATANHAPATRIMLDAIQAEFLGVAALLVLYVSVLSPVRGGRRLAAQVVAQAALAAGALAVAGLVAVAFQWASGYDHLQLPLYVSGLFFNLGWPLLHLLALAIFLQAVTGSRWAIVAAGGIFLFTRLALEHPLLRFGAPISPWSDLNGYGPFLAEHLVAGAFWTAFSVFLLLAAHVCRRPRRAARLRLTRNVVANAWVACVAGAVAGLWLLLHASATVAVPPSDPEISPQPAYSRLDFAVDIFPERRSLRSRGTAILVNPHDVAIPRLQFTVPYPMEVYALSLTGEFEQRDGRRLAYRLNRPLEPKETLRIEFDLGWQPEALPRARLGTGVLANGTLVYTADILPAIGDHDASNLVFRARIGTALDQIAIAPGVLARRWQEEGRRSYFEYHSEHGASLDAPIVSARYAVARRDWQGTPVEIYHHPARAPDLRQLLAAAEGGASALAGAPLRVVAVPDYRRHPDRPWVLGRMTRTTPTRFVDGVLCYSELDVLTTPARSSSSRRASS